VSEQALVGTAPPRAGRALAAVTGAVLVLWGLHNALLRPWEERRLAPELLEPLLVALRGLVWMLPVVLYLRRFEPKGVIAGLGLRPPLGRRGLVRGGIVGLAYLLLLAGLSSVTGGGNPGASLSSWLLTVPAACMLAVTVLEELFWRGFLLGQLARHTTSRRAQLTVALLFAGMHLPGWIGRGGADPAVLVPMTIMLFLLGVVLGWVTRLSGSIHLAVLVHLGNNLLAQRLS
jgi:membrane protease YdiL (CAAX protease family)